ncbi:TPA: hypothetical protein ACLGN2_004793, partial [Salmonella enterica]
SINNPVQFIDIPFISCSDQTGEQRAASPLNAASSGMEAPADIEYGTVSKWRRSPAQPVTGCYSPHTPSYLPEYSDHKTILLFIIPAAGRS